LDGMSRNRCHRNARGTGEEGWIGSTAEKTLTRGPEAVLCWTVRRVVVLAYAAAAVPHSSGDAWMLGGGEEDGECGRHARARNGAVLREPEMGGAPCPRPCRSWHGPDHANVGIDIDLSPQSSKRDEVCVTMRQMTNPTTFLTMVFAKSKLGVTRICEKQHWTKVGFKCLEG